MSVEVRVSCWKVTPDPFIKFNEALLLFLEIFGYKVPYSSKINV